MHLLVACFGCLGGLWGLVQLAGGRAVGGEVRRRGCGEGGRGAVAGGIGVAGGADAGTGGRVAGA